VRIHLLAFAGLRELLGASERELALPQGARVRDAWAALAQRYPALDDLRASTRLARNGRITTFDDTLANGDELALLPPVGGG
jgi:molybdopterin converting factor small subunit